LEEFPKSTIASITTAKIKREAILLETQRLNPQKSIVRDLQGKAEPDELIKVTSKKTPDTPPNSPKSSVKTTPSGEKLNLSIPKSQKINLETVKKSPIETRKELKNYAKDIESKQPLDLTSYTATGTVNLSMTGIRAREKIILDTGLKIQTDQLQKTKTAIKSKQGLIINQKDILKEQQKTLLGNKPILDPRFSLVVDTGTKTEQDSAFDFVTIQKQKTEFIPLLTYKVVPTSPKKPIFLAPPIPNAIIPQDDIKLQKKKSRGRLLRMFYRTDVNTEKVGQYLPVSDITVSRKKKDSIGRIDKFQRKFNKKLDKQNKRNKKRRFSFF